MSLVQRRSLALDEMGKQLESRRFNRIISNRTLQVAAHSVQPVIRWKPWTWNGHGDRYQYLYIKLLNTWCSISDGGAHNLKKERREQLSSHRPRRWPGPSAAVRDRCSEWGLAYSPCVTGVCMSGSPTVGSWTVGGTLRRPSLYIVCATNNYKHLYLWVISYW